MTVFKIVLMISICAILLYGLFFLLPEKLRLLNKYGMHLANQDLIKMAKDGNVEIQSFYRKSKIFLAALLSNGVLLSLIHELTRK